MLAPTPIKPSYQSAAKFTAAKVDSPIKPAVYYKKLISRQGRRQLQSEVEAIASSCFAQIIAE